MSRIFKKTSDIRIFYICYGILFFAANLVHPITPAFFEKLEYPHYMFGVSYALMAVGAFILSPMWSKLADKYGTLKIMGIGVIFYGIGQFGFSIANTITSTALARIFAGAFSAAMNVGAILHISNAYEEKSKNQRIALAMAINVSAGAIGFFFGGYFGSIDIMLPFRIQPIMCILDGIIVILLLKDFKLYSTDYKIQIEDINPLKAIKEVIKIIDSEIIMFYMITIFCYFAFTCFDTSFNYYIRRVYSLSPIYNGVIKGSIGVLGLILNISLNKWIASRFNPKSTITVYFSVIFVSLIILIITKDIPLFIASALMYYTIDSMLKPIMQILGTRSSIIYGGYNSLVSFGGVTGSLVAGYLYNINKEYPFFASATMVCLAIILSVVYKKIYITKKAD